MISTHKIKSETKYDIVFYKYFKIIIITKWLHKNVDGHNGINQTIIQRRRDELKARKKRDKY